MFTHRLPLAALAAAVLLSGCSENDKSGPPPVGPPPVYGYTVVADYPHDPDAFTQGLVFHDGGLFESTGLYGQSSLRRVRLQDGEVEQRHELESQFFGEGLALHGGKLYQLTWREHQGFIYDPGTFEQLGVFGFPSPEGWGLTTDGERLILSDGSAVLYWLDPVTLGEVRRDTVRDRGAPQYNLNELEYVKGEIWANRLNSDRIVRIDPETGDVAGWIDLDGLHAGHPCPQRGVLNGIAYDPESDRLFVTGKNWCRLFEIRLTEPRP